ncbi:MAG: polyphosphate kinase 2 family protein [Verrucomicrobiales bacterium]|nr:polyphosphate kinase 2 family protein [Verrucomicrobiales bacterium]
MSKLDIPAPADHPFRIQPGTTVDLNEVPTRHETLFPMEKSEGKELFDDLEDEIDDLQTRLYAEDKHKLLVVMQAMDTGGKDGTIRDVFDKMDPQGIRVASFKRPSKKELAHDYLWRVHKQTPATGQTVIFNRSHYEDIVAVRVREIFPESRWSKRYEHIVNFEKLLADEGTTILKIFLHISMDEQKERLQARLDEPGKNWKFNPGDLDDRALWPKFMEAYSDVLSRTSTDHAPWYVIPADRKWYRNLAIAQILIGTLRELNMQYPPVDFDPKAIVID